MPDFRDRIYGDAAPKDIEKAIKKAIAQNQERIASINIEDHYRQALAYIDDQFAFFLTDILNMGHPEWDVQIPTAAVYIPEDSTEFRFIVNPTFAALLEPGEFAFVLGHETMHILFNHLRVLPSMEAQGAITKKINIAADCVINDFLVDQGLELSERLAANLCRGQKWCGYNARYSTVRSVYRDLDKDQYQQMQDQEDALSEYLEGLGLPATGGHQWVYEQEGSQGRAEQMAKSEHSLPQVQQQKDNEDQKTKEYSAGAAGSDALVSRFQETNKVSLRWAKLLSQVNPDMFKLHGPMPAPSFLRVPRRLIDMYDQSPHMGRLPTTEIIEPKNGEQAAIVMYLDGSGSCADWIDRFVTLAKSVPEDKIALFPFSFSTIVLPLDIKEKNPKVAAGGTEFSCIEESIQKDVVPRLGNYPKAVVVLSDGQGAFQRIRPKYEDRWLWLIKTNNGSRYDYKDRGGTDVLLSDFMKGM